MSKLNPVKRHYEHCRETRARMSDYVDGKLEPPAAAAVERHVRWCRGCQRMLTNLRRTIGGLHRLRDEPTPADEPGPPASEQS